MSMQKAKYPRHEEEVGDEVNLGVVFLVAIMLLLALSAVIYFGGVWILPPTTPAPQI